jgi:cellulose synthase/poly-beta-1,6-N-acetylglucosamine synthase-like glycosyltransferase
MSGWHLVGACAVWGSLALVGFVYAGYPLFLLAVPRRKGFRRSDGPLPPVSVVIAAHNEARVIAATVENKLAQDYPKNLLDVIVVSDGSEDGTDELVERIGDDRVTLLRQEPRQGKTLALNRALQAARGEIVVISDANSLYRPDAVRRLVAAFEDDSVGYATGCLVYRDPGETAVGGGSGMYMRYENWLRTLESRAGSIVGVNGGIDAVRSRLYSPMRADHLPDFILPLRVIERGLRVVYCEGAVSSEDALGRQEAEYRMRVRVSLRALHGLAEMRHLLAPRFGLFGFQLLVHKLLRYVLFAPLVVALISSALLSAWPLYRALFVLQLLCYALAAVGWLSAGRIRLRPVFVPFYFCLLNVAAADALFRFLRGERQVLWTPRKGA